MSIPILDNKFWFPPVDSANDDGLLAMGGGLENDRLLLAYRQGIFPWYEGNIPLWWSPDPRFVLYPDQLHVSKSMKKIIEGNQFKFTINRNFPSVMKACKHIQRKDAAGTWINDALIDAFIELHNSGFAHSAEAWLDDELVGGLYGIRMGNIFFGESMFSKVSNASKYAFIKYVQLLQLQNIQLIDCQVYSDHLQSLGATFISRRNFLKILEDQIPAIKDA
ncbi:MAG: leucyl/phenylalanyl-tRNA--protein transferase [Bacteroidetes bacterium]|nr:leucyl/phenylalanyl-tRNA--protein transferase [Bacteroidota bacterium]